MDDTEPPAEADDEPTTPDADAAAGTTADVEVLAEADVEATVPRPPGVPTGKATGLPPPKPPDAPDAPRSAEAKELFAPPPPKRTDDDVWDAEDSLLSWKLFAALFVVLVLVGFGAYKLFGGNKATETGSSPSSTTPAGGAAADITDDFAGESTNGLGTTTTGQKWEIPDNGGTWGKTGNHAYLVTPSTTGGNRSIALVDLQSGNGSVSAKAVKIEPGWGLVFRYRGPFNFWMLTVTPKFGTYNLQKVVDGKVTTVGNTGLAKLDDNTEVQVDFQGEKISVFANGDLLKSFVDPQYVGPQGGKVGLIGVDAGAKESQWGSFSARKLGAGSSGPPKPAGSTAPAAAEVTTTTAGGGNKNGN